MLKLRTGLLLGILFLVAGIIASVIFAVTVFVEQAERRSLDDRLRRGRNVFVEMLAFRQASVKSDCLLTANAPLLRATIDIPEVTRETVDDALKEVRKSLEVDLLMVTDESGVVLGEVTNASASGYEPGNAVVRAARDKGAGAGVWVLADRPIQVHACRMAFGDRVIGIVVVGQIIGDGMVQAIYRQTGSTALVALAGKAVAASSLAADQATPAGHLDGLVIGEEPTEVRIGDASYLGIGARLPGYDGTRSLAFAVLRSLDEALAPGKRVKETILAIAGVSLVLALLIAFLVANGLSRPVNRLVEFSQRIGKGDLKLRARASGAKELRTLATAMNTMVEELETTRQTLAEKERLEREMDIAKHIQTSILPRDFAVRGLEIAAQMIPADEVGGDYYDILPVKDGCWIGIGDVAGHGLTAGLEMMMVQSVVSALVCKEPDGAPRDHVTTLNHVMYENIRERLRKDEYVTFTLFRYRARERRLVFAGAHEEIVVLRSANGQCERWETPGTWIGGMPDIGAVTHDSTIELATGDLVLLYTDGITEARNAEKEQYGLARLEAVLLREQYAPVAKIRDAVLAEAEAWQARREDDLSVVVLRVVA